MTSSARPSQQDKRARDERLQELISEFRTAATEGIRVEFVDPESQLLCQGIFKLDSGLGSMSLQPAFLPETSWPMRDIGYVMKGSEFARRVPELAHLSANCVGIDFDTEMKVRCLHFQDQTLRDDFYACLKILRMCAENVSAGSIAGA
jgi:hypothetical protein